jgi:hypothetical protein
MLNVTLRRECGEKRPQTVPDAFFLNGHELYVEKDFSKA